MKKFGILCLALVIALGALGVGYATWTDTIFISGTVQTGSVCLAIEDFAEINACPSSQYAATPDKNWSGWSYTQGQESCPPFYTFDSKPCTDKDVASISFVAKKADGTVIPDPDAAGAPPVELLEVTIDNAYPHYLGWITFHICNCGTVPLMLQPVVITQSPFLLIEYGNGDIQLEPGVCHEVSLYVGVVQHEGYFASAAPDSYVVDDITKPMLPMNTPLSFTITVEGIQWDE